MKLTAIGIHPDDVELGCGATVALAARQGYRTSIVDLSPGSSSTNGTPEERQSEAQEAARILGVAERINLGLPDTAIEASDRDQTAAVVSALRRLKPDILLVPNREDPHPDHSAGGELVERALYLSGVGGYGEGDPWKPKLVMIYMCRAEFRPHLVVDVSSTHEIKMRAIEAHRSQFLREEGRRETVLNSPGFLPHIEARGRIYGWRIGAAFGEPFLLPNPLGVRRLERLCGGDEGL